MTKLTFSHKDVIRCVEHALAAPNHSMGYGDNSKPRPALFFVKDDGIYVMSNGTPRDAVAPPAPKCFVAYAKGYDPATGNVWDKCRNAVGGDDFSENIELTPAIVADIRKGSDLFISVTETTLKVWTEIKRSDDETRKWLEGVMAKHTVGYPTARHKNLKAWKSGVDAEAIKRRYPKVVILNELPLDQAVAAYRG